MAADLRLEFPGDLELERRLEAFGDLRLGPSGATTTRMRQVVMTAAHRRSALAEADRRSGSTAARKRPAADDASALAVRWRQRWLRPVGAMLAACLTLAVLTGTAIAAKPGGPLYDARLFTEWLTLPETGSPARTSEEITRLEARLSEASVASSIGDEDGAAAAILAYSAIAVEAVADSRDDRLGRRALENEVARHSIALTRLVEAVPEPSRESVESAVMRIQGAFERAVGE